MGKINAQNLRWVRRQIAPAQLRRSIQRQQVEQHSAGAADGHDGERRGGAGRDRAADQMEATMAKIASGTAAMCIRMSVLSVFRR
jgi:hypothetical protein